MIQLREVILICFLSQHFASQFPGVCLNSSTVSKQTCMGEMLPLSRDISEGCNEILFIKVDDSPRDLNTVVFSLMAGLVWFSTSPSSANTGA